MSCCENIFLAKDKSPFTKFLFSLEHRELSVKGLFAYECVDACFFYAISKTW